MPGNRRDLRTVFYLKDKTSREFRHTAAKVYQLPPRGSDFRIGDVNKRVTFCAVSGELLEEFTFEPHTGHSDRAPEQALMVGRVASLSASCNDSVPVMFEPTPVSAESEDEGFQSCVDEHPVLSDGRLQVVSPLMRPSGRAGDIRSPRVLALQHAPDGAFRQQVRSHLSCSLSLLQNLQRKTHTYRASQWGDHILPSEGYCRNTCLPAPRSCGEGDLVRDAGANEYIVDGLGPGGVEQRVPYPLDAKGDLHAAGAVIKPCTEFYRIYTPEDPEEAHPSGNHDSSRSGSVERKFSSDGGCQGPDSGSSPGHIKCSDPRGCNLHRPRGHAVANHGSNASIGGCNACVGHASSSPVCGCSGEDPYFGEPGLTAPDRSRLPPEEPQHATTQPRRPITRRGRERLPTSSSVRRSHSTRSRLGRFLGACALALVGTQMAGPCQTSLMQPERGVEADESRTRWPKVCQEVDVRLEPTSGLELPQGWMAVTDMSRRATRPQLRSWLGPQAWKLDRSLRVGLIEVYAGKATLSDAYEELGGEAIRIGRAWGQELRSPEARWYLSSLLQICKPDDVLVAFPCTAHCQWSSYNEHRGLATRRKVAGSFGEQTGPALVV